MFHVLLLLHADALPVFDSSRLSEHLSRRESILGAGFLHSSSPFAVLSLGCCAALLWRDFVRTLWISFHNSAALQVSLADYSLQAPSLRGLGESEVPYAPVSAPPQPYAHGGVQGCGKQQALHAATLCVPRGDHCRDGGKGDDRPYDAVDDSCPFHI